MKSDSAESPIGVLRNVEEVQSVWKLLLWKSGMTPFTVLYFVYLDRCSYDSDPNIQISLPGLPWCPIVLESERDGPSV